jgi:hypothetical protein
VRGLARLQLAGGRRGGDLAQQRHDLRPGERLLRDRPRGAADIQLRDISLDEEERVAAIADENGEKAVELSHLSPVGGRGRSIGC